MIEITVAKITYENVEVHPAGEFTIGQMIDASIRDAIAAGEMLHEVAVNFDRESWVTLAHKPPPMSDIIRRGPQKRES